MNASQALVIVSAATLLLVADYTRRQLGTGEAGELPDWSDEVNALAMEAKNVISPSPVSGLVPSAQLVAMLKRRERLSLTRYDLGDGGHTIGYGHFEPHGGRELPATITREQAEAWFADDIEARAARWVRAYVTAPQTQHQFDALVHMAFNLSPKSFRKIAAAVNVGDDPEATALQFIRAGTNLENGLRNRRREEMNLYRHGVYA